MSSDRSSASSLSLTPQHYVLRRNIGNLSTNPFLNFLAVLRPKMRGVPAKKIIDRAMRLWNKMNQRERKPYHDMAKLAKRRGTYTGPQDGGGAFVQRQLNRLRQRARRSLSRGSSRGGSSSRGRRRRRRRRRQRRDRNARVRRRAY